MSVAIRAPILAALLVATALAGCFAGQPTTDEPAFLVSRAHTIDLNADRAQILGDTSGPEAFVRALVDTALVVRVAEAGDYVLAYTDESGMERRETLSGLQPGTPRSVAGADPFAGAKLLQGDNALATRAPITTGWWQMGDFPVGLRADAPASAIYDLSFDARADLEVIDVTASDGSGHLESLIVRLALPATGEAKWTLSPEGVEERLDVSGKLALDDSRGSLFFGEAKGDMDGKPMTAGVEVRSGNAGMDGAATFWLTDGSFSAAQFQGGRAHANPDVIVWATGTEEMGEEFPCASKTREDACSPEELPSFDETEPAQDERQELALEDAPRAEGDEAREALRIIERLFAMDLGLHDKLTIRATAAADELGAAREGNDFDIVFEQVIEVVKRETISIPAGSFDAYRIVQTTSIDADIERLANRHCAAWNEPQRAEPQPYPTPTSSSTSPPPPPRPEPYYPSSCAEYETQAYLSGFALDGVLARATLWLDATTYQPLKGSVESPLDLGHVARDLLGSLDTGGWEELNLKQFDRDRFRLSTTSTAAFEARELTGDAAFSPAIGLVMGGMLGGTWGGVLPSAFGPRHSMAEPVMMERPVSPPRYLSLASAGALDDGVKSYQVTSASPDFYWSDVAVLVDGGDRMFAFGEPCDGGEAYQYVVCNDGVPQTYRDTVDAGDVLRLPGVESGMELRILDAHSNATVLVLTIS